MALTLASAPPSREGSGNGLVGLSETRVVVAAVPGDDDDDSGGADCGVRCWEGDFMTALRLGVKVVVGVGFFLAFAGSDMPGGCEADLRSWLLVGGLVTLVLTLCCFMVTSCVHRTVTTSLTKRDLSEDDEVVQKYLNRASWGATCLTAVWGLCWAVVAIAKLKKGSKSTCGSSFTATVFMVAVSILTLFFFAISLLSYATTGDDDEGGGRGGSPTSSSVPPRPPCPPPLTHPGLERKIITPMFSPRDPPPPPAFDVPMVP